MSKHLHYETMYNLLGVALCVNNRRTARELEEKTEERQDAWGRGTTQQAWCGTVRSERALGGTATAGTSLSYESTRRGGVLMCVCVCLHVFEEQWELCPPQAVFWCLATHSQFIRAATAAH